MMSYVVRRYLPVVTSAKTGISAAVDLVGRDRQYLRDSVDAPLSLRVFGHLRHGVNQAKTQVQE